MKRRADQPLLLAVFLALALQAHGAPAQSDERAGDDEPAGLGVVLKSEDGTLMVMRVLPASPAERAGLRKGDRIVAIDGQTTAEEPLEKMAERLRGKAGSQVILIVVSEGRSARHLRIRRGPIDVPKPGDFAAREAAIVAAEQADHRVAAVRIAQEALLREAKAQMEPLREPFSREVEFMVKVGELTADQRESLKTLGEQAIERRGAMFALQGNGMIGNRAIVIVNGVLERREVPPHETAERAVRSELGPVLKDVSHEGWKKFEAESERLDRRRKQADVLVQVAALDEALLLTRDQREKLCDFFSTEWETVFRGQVNDDEPVTPTLLCLTPARAMDLFSIPDVKLETMLRPTQIEAFKLVQLPARFETVFIEEGPQAGQAALNEAAGNVGNLAKVRAGIVAQQGLIGRKFVRQGLPVKDERQHLESLLSRLVDNADAHGMLDEAQTHKLLLAGRLDIERHFQQSAQPEKAPGQVRMVEQRQIAGSNVQLPPIFSDAASIFQKALHSRLSPQQLARLAEAERERGRFHRQAVIATLTTDLAQRATLTDEQAQRVQNVMTDLLQAAGDTDNLAEFRFATLRELGNLQPELIQPFLDAWQQPAAKDYLNELAATARALASQPATPPPLADEPEEALLGIPAAP